MSKRIHLAIAAHLKALADGEAVPAANADDPRWDKLSGADGEFEDDLDDWEDDGQEELDAKPPKRRQSPRRKRSEWDEKIQRHIRGKSREELTEQVLSLVERCPELREEFCERIALSEGDVAAMIGKYTAYLLRVGKPMSLGRPTGGRFCGNNACPTLHYFAEHQ